MGPPPQMEWDNGQVPSLMRNTQTSSGDPKSRGKKPGGGAVEGLALPWGNCPKRPMPAAPLPWCRAGWPVRGGQDHGGEWAEPGEHHHGQRRESAHGQQPSAPDGETYGPSAGHQVLQGEDHMVRRPGPGPDLAPPCPAHPAHGRRGRRHRALRGTWLCLAPALSVPLALETQRSQGLTL